MKPHETPESSSIALAEEVSQLVSSGVLDKDFVGYLKFAIEEERNRIMKKNRAENVVVGGAGGEDDVNYEFDPGDPENRWLSVLLLIQQGVYSEMGRKIKDYVDIYWYSLRMKTKYQRQYVLRKNVEELGDWEVKKFREIGENIIGALGGGWGGRGGFGGRRRRRRRICG